MMKVRLWELILALFLLFMVVSPDYLGYLLGSVYRAWLVRILY